jgi:hypothetical protein
MHSTNILERTLVFLKCMVNEHVFMNILSLSTDIDHDYFLDLQNSACFGN